MSSYNTKQSNLSIKDLPNLPGVRRTPTLHAQRTRDGLVKSGLFIKGSLLEDRSVVEDDEQNSIVSFFETKSIASFPSNADNFNDLSGRYSLKSQQQDRLTKSRSLPFCSLDSAPPFVVNAKERVCRFLAYFTEKVPENLIERTRSRKVEISFYVEDQTISIIEPKDGNSGLVQGIVLKRHQVENKKRPGEIYCLNDFRSGETLEFYNRIYVLIDCDQATRNYLENVNLSFGESLPLPPTYLDPKIGRVPRSRASTAEGSSPTSSATNQKIAGFHLYGRKILRFFGVWDSRYDLFGDELNVRLHYTLADDSIEVLPINNRNSGRDRVQKLLRKTKIIIPDSDDFSLISPPTSAGSTLGRPPSAMDTSRTPRMMPQIPPKTYHWTDLNIGATITVAAMKILLLDADEFTREFYFSKKTPLGQAIVLPSFEYPKLNASTPPYNGFGSEIDSLTSCKGSLIPSAPHKDGAKLKAFQGMVLRYLATLDSTEVRIFFVKFNFIFHFNRLPIYFHLVF